MRGARAAALLAASAVATACAAVEATEDAAGRRRSSLEVDPPRAVLLPSRLDADGRAVATRLAWIPDARRPWRFALRPGAGAARLRLDLTDDDGFAGWLTRFEAGADARAPGLIDAAGRAADAILARAAAVAGGR